MTGHPERDWPESKSPHRPGSNDNYMNICSQCSKAFAGNKRRVVCRACAETAAERDRLREINADLLEAAKPLLAALIKDCGELMDGDDDAVGWIIAPDESESQDMAVTFRMMKDLSAAIAKAGETA